MSGWRVEHHPQPAADERVVVGEQHPGLQRRRHALGEPRSLPPERRDRQADRHAGPARLRSPGQRRSASPARACRRDRRPARSPPGQAAPSSVTRARPVRLARPERDPHSLAPGVTQRVGQRLLGDAVDHELHLRAEGRQAAVQLASHRDRALLFHPQAQRDQRVARPRSSSASGRSSRAIRRTSSEAAAGRSRDLLQRRRLLGKSPATRSACSATAVSVWPTSSCSSRATRSRSASWAASARRALSRRSVSSARASC